MALTARETPGRFGTEASYRMGGKHPSFPGTQALRAFLALPPAPRSVSARKDGEDVTHAAPAPFVLCGDAVSPIRCPCPQLWCLQGHPRTARAGRAQHSSPRASPSPVPGDDAFPERLKPEALPGTHTLPRACGQPRAAPAPLRSHEGFAALPGVARPPPGRGEAGSQQGQGQSGRVRPAPRRLQRPRARAEPLGARLSRSAAAEPGEPPGGAGGRWGGTEPRAGPGWRRRGLPGSRSAPPRRIPAESPPHPRQHPRGPRRRTQRLGRRPSAVRG